MIIIYLLSEHNFDLWRKGAAIFWARIVLAEQLYLDNKTLSKFNSVFLLMEIFGAWYNQFVLISDL